ncbi:hypothetical protein ACOSQ3_004696 [Xanthoceras sorbifolium]
MAEVFMFSSQLEQPRREEVKEKPPIFHLVWSELELRMLRDLISKERQLRAVSSQSFSTWLTRVVGWGLELVRRN